MVKIHNALEDNCQTVICHIGLMCEKVEEKIRGNWLKWDEYKGL